MKQTDYQKPTIAVITVESQQLLCMSVRNFYVQDYTLVEEEYVGF